MKVVYRHYEPDQGLEEHQAKIYTEVSGLPATADQIRARFSSVNKDPKTVRYALTEDGQPLAYVQSTKSTSHPGRTYISYPWALPNCPAEVQEKIFDELLSYVQEQEDHLETAVSIVVRSKIADEQIEFLQKKGFIEKERIFWYVSDMDVSEITKQEITADISSFNSRLATNDDLDLLIEICQADPQIRDAFPTREAWMTYFRDRVLKDGHTVLVFKGDQAVAAGAPLRIQPGHPVYNWDEERTIMRFTATRPGYSQAMKRLLLEIAKECSAAGWSAIPLRIHFYFRTNSTTATTLADMKQEIQTFEIIFSYS
ncbi:MAG: hypothetical protein ACFFD4_16070 [Candidatus Odinarchaeota archaeon]